MGVPLASLTALAVVLVLVGGVAAAVGLVIGGGAVAGLVARHRGDGVTRLLGASLAALALADVLALVAPRPALALRAVAVLGFLVGSVRAAGALGESASRVVLADASWSAVAVVLMAVDVGGSADQVAGLTQIGLAVFTVSLWVQLMTFVDRSPKLVTLVSASVALMAVRVVVAAVVPMWTGVVAATGLTARVLFARAIALPSLGGRLPDRTPSPHEATASRAIVSSLLLVVVATLSRVREVTAGGTLPVWQLVFPMLVLLVAVVHIRALYLTAMADNRELRRSAMLDPTTESLNERGLLGVLDERRPQDSLLLVVEVDGLRSLLRRSATPAGVDLAVAVTRRLEQVAGLAPTVARCGEEEFVLVSGGEPAPLARSVRDTLNEALLLSAASVSVAIGVRIGWARIDQQESSSALELARFAAAEAAAGETVGFTAEQRDRYRRQRTLIREFPTAVRDGQITPHYQAIMSVETGRILSFEVLARWTHPEHGPIAPGAFIPLAESSGAIVHLGARLLADACLQLAQWRRMPGLEDLGVAVNLSPRQLEDPDLERRVAAALHRAELPPEALTLELTEGMLLDVDRDGHRLVALKSMGVGLAVDDFGTGYSSLSYIDRLRPDVVKVDRHFTQALTRPDGEVAWGIFSLLAQLDYPVVAEGVEDEETLAALRAVGCRRWQGFLHGRPASARETTRLLQSATEGAATPSDGPSRAAPTPPPATSSGPLGSATVAPFVRPAVVVDTTTCWGELDSLFVGNPTLRTVVVRRDDDQLAIVTASDVHQLMTGPYGFGRSLHAAEPIGDRLGAPTRPIEPGTAVVDAVAGAMARPAEHRYDDLLVVAGRGRPGLVVVSALLAELANDFGRLAVRDDLTGLPNRRHFIATLDDWLARDRPLGVLYLDLDGFKPINDGFGHATGDAVLVEVARRLRSCARGVDVVARLGGDEFAVAMRDATVEVVTQVAERVLRALQPVVRWEGHELEVAASIGCAVGRWSSPDELIRAADSSMYLAKRDPDVSVGPLATGDEQPSRPVPPSRAGAHPVARR